MTTGTFETFEQRLATLEQEITQVKARLEPENTRKSNPWLDYVYGAFKDDPLFEQAVKYGREWRESQNEVDDEENDDLDGHG